MGWIRAVIHYLRLVLWDDAATWKKAGCAGEEMGTGFRCEGVNTK